MAHEVGDAAHGIDLLRPHRSVRWLQSVAALLAAIAVLRSAGFVFGILNIDESDFTLIAKRMLQGAVPFAQIADIKPPLAYVPFLPAGLFGGLSITPVHVLGIFLVVATCLVLGRPARARQGDDLASS